MELSVNIASEDSMVIVPLGIELVILDEDEPTLTLRVNITDVSGVVIMDDVLDVSVSSDKEISVIVPGSTSDMLMLNISVTAIDGDGAESNPCDFSLIITPIRPALCVNPHLEFPAILFTVYSVSLLVDIERDQVSYDLLLQLYQAREFYR